jgi:peptide/nickel transport system substrate-binding protein
MKQVLATAILGLALTACLAPRQAAAEVLQVAVDASPAGLDPHIVTAFSSFQIINGTIYEGLTAIDANLDVVPSLAKSWTISPDGKTYTFHLVTNATFHDGAKFEAADVVASLHRVLSKAIASPLASRLAGMESVRAVDPATVEIVLKEPAAAFLSGLASIAMVPRAFEANKDALQRQPDGTGPFKFVEWQPNGFISLTRHTGYWKPGLPKLDGVKFIIAPESATRQVGLTSGQYAMLPNIDAATALQLKGRPGVKLAQTLDLAYSLVGMNASRPPFNDARVREALNTAINRQEIITAALYGAGVPAGPLSPAMHGWASDTKSFPCYTPSADRAKALLKQAGFTAPVPVTLLVLPRQDTRDIAQVVQAELNNAGFKVELKIPELGQFVQDWKNSNFDAFVSLNGGAVDPDDTFYRTFHSGGSTNVFKYADKEVDTLLDTGRDQQSTDARRATYTRLQSILACQGPVAFVAYGQLFTAMRDSVKGFEINATRSLGALATTTDK